MKTLARIAKFTIHPHPNADALSLAKIQGTGWQVVIKTTDWVGSPHRLQEQTSDGQDVYEGIYIALDSLLDVSIPEFSFLSPKATKTFPDGRKGHRLKTVRLRGQVSQGLVIPVPESVRFLMLTVPPETIKARFLVPPEVRHLLNPIPDQELLAAAAPALALIGGDITEADLENLYICEALKIERYEPPIPVDLRGEMVRSPGSFVHYTDIEDAKNHPTWFTEGEQVRATEKIHGTNFRVGMVFDGKEDPEYILGSHTTAKKQVPDGGTTLYAIMADKHFPKPAMEKVVKEFFPFNEHFVIMGEVYGNKVQDLNYGCDKNVRKVRIYDVVIDHTYQPWETVQKVATLFDVETVPLLYRGPFNAQAVLELRDGKSTVPGASHVREGCVVTAEPEARVVDEDGSTYRKILKYISDEYLCRSGEKDGH